MEKERILKNECDYCRKSTEGLSHRCKFCGQIHCSNHLLPESHNCEGLKKYKAGNADRWRNAVLSTTKYNPKEENDWANKRKSEKVKWKITNKKDDKTSKKLPQEIKDAEKKHNDIHKRSSVVKRLTPDTPNYFWKILLLVFFVVLIFGAYVLYQHEKKVEPVYFVDELSKSAFDYVNQYRLTNDVAPLNFSFEMYSSLSEFSRKKQINETGFENSADVNNFLKNNVDLSDFTSRYVNIYFIKGQGIEGFKKEFDKGYSARKLIGDKKYLVGAVGCSLDYCTLSVVGDLVVGKNQGSVAVMESNVTNPKNSNDKPNSLISEKNSASVSSLGSKIGNFFSLLFNVTNQEISSVASNIGITHNITNIELLTHNLINEQRNKNGLPILKFDSKLAEIARAHSQDMAQNNFFEHTNLNGQDPTMRANSARYSCHKDYGAYYTEGIAENIAMTPTGDVIGCGGVSSDEDIARCTVDGWMNSPGHRMNILTATYSQEGIGVASSGGKFYITQDFC